MKELKFTALVGISYFSPLIGLILFAILKYKKAEKFFQNAVLIGSALALLFYVAAFFSPQT